MGKPKKRFVIQSRKAQIKAMRLKGQESLMAKKSYNKAKKCAKINFNNINKSDEDLMSHETRLSRMSQESFEFEISVSDWLI